MDKYYLGLLLKFEFKAKYLKGRLLDLDLGMPFEEVFSQVKLPKVNRKFN